MSKLTPLFEYDKTIQALNYFLNKEPSKSMSKLKLVKLLFLADRYTLRKYGYSLTGDKYFAMEHGPVGSSTKRILDGEVDGDGVKVVSRYVIKSDTSPDLEEFSETDLESLKKIWKSYGHMSAIQVRDFTHKLPEWRRYEKRLKVNPRQALEIKVDDFFSNPEVKVQNYIFNEDPDTLNTNKENFKEELELNSVFA